MFSNISKVSSVIKSISIFIESKAPNNAFEPPGIFIFPNWLRCDNSKMTKSEIKYWLPLGYKISSRKFSSNFGFSLTSQ